MKLRTGFVSNSSCSSFSVPLSALTRRQKYYIEDHVEHSKRIEQYDPDYRDACHEDDAWNIHCDDTHLYGSTIMDNFDMRQFLIAIGVDMSKVEWDD